MAFSSDVMTQSALVFFDESGKCDYLCLICRQHFNELSELQLHAPSHTEEQAHIKFSVKQDWIDVNMETSQNIGWFEVSVTMVDFIKNVWGAEDVRVTAEESSDEMKVEHNQECEGLIKSEDTYVTINLGDINLEPQDIEDVPSVCESEPAADIVHTRREKTKSGRQNKISESVENDLEKKPEPYNAYGESNCEKTLEDDIPTPKRRKRGKNKEKPPRKAANTVYMCKVCSWTSQRHYNYHRHFFTHSHRGELQNDVICDYCDKPIEESSGKSGYGQRKGFCDICNAGPFHLGKLSTHMIQDHHVENSPASGKQVLRCTLCEYQTSKPSLLGSHMTKHHTERSCLPPDKRSKLMCDKCVYTTNRKDLLEQHMLTHSAPEELEVINCKHCDFVALTTNGMKVHLRMHNDQIIDCPVCASSDISTSINVSSLKQHLIDVHEILEPHCCEKCGKVVETKTMLEEHLLTHGKEKPTLYICFYCAVNMGSKEDLREHQRLHYDSEGGGISQIKDILSMEQVDNDGAQQGDQSSDIKLEIHEAHAAKNTKNKFSGACAECNFVTDKAARFLRHQLKHARKSHVTTKLECAQCDNTFQNLNTLNNHLSKGHGVKNFSFQCGRCGILTKSKAAQDKHSKTHYQSKVQEMYICVICGHEASRRWNLLRHIEKRHLFNEYTCEYCEYSTPSLSRVQNHYEATHMQPVPESIRKAIEKSNTAKLEGASLKNVFKKPKPISTKKPATLVKEFCDNCGMMVDKRFMKKHMNRHKGIKPFKCQYEDCFYSAVSSGMIKTHIQRKHLGMRASPRKRSTKSEIVEMIQNEYSVDILDNKIINTIPEQEEMDTGSTEAVSYFETPMEFEVETGSYYQVMRPTRSASVGAIDDMPGARGLSDVPTSRIVDSNSGPVTHIFIIQKDEEVVQ